MSAHIKDKRAAYLVTGSCAALGICKIVKIALKGGRQKPFVPQVTTWKYIK